MNQYDTSASGRLPHAFTTPGSSSFVEFLSSHAPHLLPGNRPTGELQAPHGTTIVSLAFDGGIVMAGDRRATMGSMIASRDIEKVFPADEYSAVGIAGTAGLAIELVRLFQLELEHYEKIEGSLLSLDGKANRLATMIRGNLGLAMQGLAVVPLFGGYDLDKRTGRIFSYDVTGGRYEEHDHHAVGSGSVFARGSLKKLWKHELDAEGAVRVGGRGPLGRGRRRLGHRWTRPDAGHLARRRDGHRGGVPARAGRPARGDRRAGRGAATRGPPGAGRWPAMSMPFYVSPEQLMKDRADYARKGIARGRSVVVLQYDDGIAFATENASRALHKISEIYDRIGFAAVGKYNEFENLRVAGVRYADLRGYSYDREDVSVRGLANAYAQTLGTVFTTESKPLEVEIVVAEVGRAGVGRPDLPARLRRLGDRRARLRGHGRPGRTARARSSPRAGAPGMTLPEVLALAVRTLGSPAEDERRAAGHPGRAAGGRRARPHAAASHVPSAGGRPAGGPARLTRPVHHTKEVAAMDRRIFGLETEYGVTCAAQDGRGLSADEVARYLFRKVVAWGRSSNVFLRNGSRLYLDVGSHPEYATAECDDVRQLVTHDRAGERILEGLVADAQQRLEHEGLPGTIHLFKNNTDSAGNSYGCHENYLVRRQGDFSRLSDVLVPFLITRQILTGAGKVLATPRGAVYCLSQRADHIWEAVSSATTRSRPIINTRDEPHADAEHYRRLHVIVGDSSMSETTTMLKVGTTDLLLRMIEAGVPMREMALENPIRAIREISHDMTGMHPITMANGRTVTAVDLQEEYLTRVSDFLASEGGPTPENKQVLDLWERGLRALRTGDLSLVDRELDWVIKYKLIERYRAKHNLELSDVRVQRLDLAYHDISRTEGLYNLLAARGMVERVTTDLEIFEATAVPPQTTRAKLRGDFVRAAQDARRDYTVDWVHLKLNDQAQRTVLCKDPFRSVDERVDRLIESM